MKERVFAAEAEDCLVRCRQLSHPPPFRAERRRITVTGIDGDRIRQIEQAPERPVHRRLAGARDVRPPMTAWKHDIAAEHKSVIGTVERDVRLVMPGQVQHGEIMGANGDVVTLVERAISMGRFHRHRRSGRMLQSLEDTGMGMDGRFQGGSERPWCRRYGPNGRG